MQELFGEMDNITKVSFLIMNMIDHKIVRKIKI